MSQQNVELLRKSFNAYNAAFHTGDPSELLNFVDPDVEWHTATAVMEPVYRGRAGVRRWVIEFQETWEALHVEPEEFISAGPDRVLVALRLRARGKASGVDVDMLLYELMTIRNGKIIERRAFRDKIRALEATGLSEQDIHVRPS